MAAAVSFSTIDYKPLWWQDEIRLVVLERGSGSDPIRCRIIHSELGVQDYEALSYEWGNASIGDLEISVNDKPFPVRENLHSALGHIRAQKDRVLWIDAMCINQADVSERNHQVHLMGRIYSEADNVIVWLGPAANDSDLAMDALGRLHERYHEEGEDHVYVANPKYQHQQHVLHRLSCSGRSREFLLCDAEVEAICKITNRAYWHRMWIIQEIQQACKLSIHCGKKDLGESAFLCLDHILRFSPLRKIEDFSSSLALLLLRQRHKPPMELHTWLYFCLHWSCVCTEPRDIIYALLGISSDSDVMPDYSKTVLEVYADVLALWNRSRPVNGHETRRLLARRLNLTPDEEKLATHLSLPVQKSLLKRSWWRPQPKSSPVPDNERFRKRPRASYVKRAIYRVLRLSSRLRGYTKTWIKKGQSIFGAWQSEAFLNLRFATHFALHHVRSVLAKYFIECYATLAVQCANLLSSTSTA